MLPLALLLIAIPYINYWAIIIIGVISQLCYLSSIKMITNNLEAENRRLKAILEKR